MFICERLVLSCRGGVGARTEWQGHDRNGHPELPYFQNYNLLTEHLFYALTQGQSLGNVNVSVSKGKAVATLLNAELPSLRCEGDRHDN